jgi:hypothetical protein
MLDHVSAEGNGEIEMKTQPILDGNALLVAHVLKTGKKVYLLACLPLFEQTRPLLHRACLDTDEAIELENPAYGIDDTLLHDTLRGEPLWKS